MYKYTHTELNNVIISIKYINNLLINLKKKKSAKILL